MATPPPTPSLASRQSRNCRKARSSSTRPSGGTGSRSSTDLRPAADRDISIEQLTPRSVTWTRLLDLARVHLGTARYDQRRTVVGHNNIGDIVFTPDQPNMFVFHTLWSWLPDGNAPLPYTVHSANLSIPDATEARPVPDLRITSVPPRAADWASLHQLPTAALGAGTRQTTQERQMVFPPYRRGVCARRHQSGLLSSSRNGAAFPEQRYHPVYARGVARSRAQAAGNAWPGTDY